MLLKTYLKRVLYRVEGVKLQMEITILNVETSEKLLIVTKKKVINSSKLFWK